MIYCAMLLVTVITEIVFTQLLLAYWSHAVQPAHFTMKFDMLEKQNRRADHMGTDDT